jgi:hypothetical protein
MVDDGRAVVDLVAELLVALDLRADAHAEAEELRGLLATPWSRYLADPAARSVLTASGAPFEVSLKLAPIDHGSRTDVSLRYVVDVADQRRGLLGNRDRYVDAAVTVTGAAGVVRELFERHLAGAGAEEPAGVMHGVGFGPGGWRRASLYFPASRLTGDELTERLPAAMAAAAGTAAGNGIEVVGYDLTGGAVSRWKTYQWSPVGALASNEHGEHDGHDGHADLRPAVALHDAFARTVAPAARGHALFLQLTGRPEHPHGVRAKAFFFCHQWGWASPAGLSELLGFLHRTLGIELEPLLRLRAVTARHGVRLGLGLLAVGGHPRPSVTFYLWPT